MFRSHQKQKQKRVKAIYNCVADNPDELTFDEGEVIVVEREEDAEWWVSITERERERERERENSPTSAAFIAFTILIPILCV